jgi:hypothetical protein
MPYFGENKDANDLKDKVKGALAPKIPRRQLATEIEPGMYQWADENGVMQMDDGNDGEYI